MSDATVCPVCGRGAESTLKEIEHMEREHPDVIQQRLTDAGFIVRDGEIIDTLADPNGD